MCPNPKFEDGIRAMGLSMRICDSVIATIRSFESGRADEQYACNLSHIRDLLRGLAGRDVHEMPCIIGEELDERVQCQQPARAAALQFYPELEPEAAYQQVASICEMAVTGEWSVDEESMRQAMKFLSCLSSGLGAQHRQPAFL